MKTSKLVISAAISGALALGALTMVQTASAAEKEKCFGVAKAGKNDCTTASSSCAGTATVDSDPTAWILLPEGLCEKLAGSSLSSG